MTKNQKQHKNVSKQKQTNKKHADSIAGSMLREVASELGLEGLFGGKLVHLSFDCPLNLRKAFKQEIMENKSSQCKELQKFMLSYIVVSRLKKHALGNTLSKLLDMPVSIGELNLNQYVQSRPRRYVRGSVVREVDVDESEVVKCVFCGSPAVGYYERLGKKKVPTGEIVPLCEFHAKFDKDTKCNFKFVRGLKDERA